MSSSWRDSNLFDCENLFFSVAEMYPRRLFSFVVSSRSESSYMKPVACTPLIYIWKPHRTRGGCCECRVENEVFRYTLTMWRRQRINCLCFSWVDFSHDMPKVSLLADGEIFPLEEFPSVIEKQENLDDHRTWIFHKTVLKEDVVFIILGFVMKGTFFIWWKAKIFSEESWWSIRPNDQIK